MNRGQLVKSKEGWYGIILSSGDNPEEVVVYLGSGERSYELKEEIEVILQPNKLPVDFTEILNRGERFFQ